MADETIATHRLLCSEARRADEAIVADFKCHSLLQKLRTKNFRSAGRENPKVRCAKILT